MPDSQSGIFALELSGVAKGGGNSGSWRRSGSSGALAPRGSGGRVGPCPRNLAATPSDGDEVSAASASAAAAASATPASSDRGFRRSSTSRQQREQRKGSGSGGNRPTSPLSAEAASVAALCAPETDFEAGLLAAVRALTNNGGGVEGRGQKQHPPLTTQALADALAAMGYLVTVRERVRDSEGGPAGTPAAGGGAKANTTAAAVNCFATEPDSVTVSGVNAMLCSRFARP